MDQIQEGFALMGVGMGVVFAFLVLLVGCLHISARFFEHFGHLFPEPPADQPAAFEDEDHSADVAVAVAAAARARKMTRG